jgi:hypothetical protein
MHESHGKGPLLPLLPGLLQKEGGVLPLTPAGHHEAEQPVAPGPEPVRGPPQRRDGLRPLLLMGVALGHQRRHPEHRRVQQHQRLQPFHRLVTAPVYQERTGQFGVGAGRKRTNGQGAPGLGQGLARPAHDDVEAHHPFPGPGQSRVQVQVDGPGQMGLGECGGQGDGSREALQPAPGVAVASEEGGVARPGSPPDPLPSRPSTPTIHRGWEPVHSPRPLPGGRFHHVLRVPDGRPFHGRAPRGLAPRSPRLHGGPVPIGRHHGFRGLVRTKPGLRRGRTRSGIAGRRSGLRGPPRGGGGGPPPGLRG